MLVNLKNSENKKRKKLLFFMVTFTTIVFSIIAFIYFSNLTSTTSEDTLNKNDITSDSQEPISVFNPDLCTVTDTIEYMYYEDKPKDWEKNNKFGLYIYAERKDFFEIAQNLVNSNEGEWGYVLIPYNVKDRDKDKWGRVFEQLNNKKLIPVIQLWDIDTDDYKDQTEEAADFLNKFVWPIRYRYISAYNEMNDSKFWYGRVDPKEYAQILDYTINIFKEENPDFILMNGAFNVTAPTDSLHMDAFEYMKQMDAEVPGIFNKLDAWASHPYPQPNFSGNPYTYGRWGIRAYEDELKFLKENLNVTKELPVFITETGWAHAEGEEYNSSYLNADTVAEFFKIAFEEIWLKDPKVRAVMPFTIRYEAPFDHFSWINKDNVPYKQYDVVKELDKVKGEPPVLIKKIVPVKSCE